MINFSRLYKLYLIVIALTIFSLTASIFVFKLNPSLDFTGGALLELQAEQKIEQSILETELKNVQITNFTLQDSANNGVIIKTSILNQETVEQLKKNLAAAAKITITESRFETVGPTLGRELILKTVLALSLSIAVILIYIAWSFKNIKFGLAAISALIHDLIVLFGSFALLGHFWSVEVDALFVTAVLTTASFSVHDTIVVFHKIRELRKSHPQVSLTSLCDKALTETIVRSLNNSLTIIFMLAALVFFGGDTIRWFAVALLIGTVTGTYSSPFVAVPLLILFTNRSKSSQ